MFDVQRDQNLQLTSLNERLLQTDYDFFFFTYKEKQNIDNNI